MVRHYFPLSGQVLVLLVVFLCWLPLWDTYFFGCIKILLTNLPKSTLFSSRSMGLLFNTMVIGVGTSLASLGIGLPLGYFLGRRHYQTRGLGTYSFLIPILIPPFISTMAWIDLCSGKGLLNRFLMALLQLDKPLLNILSLGGTVFVLTLSYFPYLALFVLSGVLSMEPSLEEAGQLSLDRRQVFWRITLPYLKPYILAGSILVFVFATSNYGVPALLGIHTYPVEIFSEFSTFFNSDRAVFSSLPLICLVSVFMFWHWQLMRRREFGVLSPQNTTLGSQAAKPEPWLSWFLGAILLLAVVIPISWIIWVSASWQSYLTALKTAWQPILTTLGVGMVTATLATILCYPAAYLIIKSKSPAAILLDLFSFLPLAIPGTILGMGMIRVWNHPATTFIYGTMAILVLGYLAQVFSFSLRCLIPPLKQVSVHLEEAYLIHQGSWFRRHFHIMLPLMKPGLFWAWVLAFVLCVGELGSTLLIIPPGKETLSLRIYNLMHYGAYEVVAALSVILLGLTILPLTPLIWRHATSNYN